MALDDNKCGRCGFLITDEFASKDSTERKPCPKCGSKSREILLAATVTAGASVSAELTVVTYPQWLLSEAQSLIDENRFEIAVVVCHLACEIATERALSTAFESKGLQYLEGAVEELLNGYNLSNDRIRKLYTALTGDAIEVQTFWPHFKESAKRRNEIMHKGRRVKKSEAESSHTAASALVSHLKR